MQTVKARQDILQHCKHSQPYYLLEWFHDYENITYHASHKEACDTEYSRVYGRSASMKPIKTSLIRKVISTAF